MNLTAIIAAIAALITGLATGMTISKNENVKPVYNQTESVQKIDTVAAEDFVSIRPSISSLPHESLTDKETEDLLFMREEEKLARDVYQTLFETWNIQIFSNIAQSEQTHTEAIRDLLNKYNLTDSVIDDSVGVFQNQDLQTLYNSLVETGKKSKTDALTVGATIEDLDIKDLQNAINVTDNSDIKLVYENLTRGSRNHLRAFSKQLSQLNVSYEPKYISIEEYESIITSQTESGNNHQSKPGRGWGQGRKN